MKTAAEIAQQINNETWDEILMAHRGVTTNQIQQVMCEAYKQALTDAAARLEPFRTQGDWKDVDVFQADILALRDSKKPEMF